MTGLLVIADVLVVRLKQHSSHDLLDKHFTDDKTRSLEELCT